MGILNVPLLKRSLQISMLHGKTVPERDYRADSWADCRGDVDAAREQVISHVQAFPAAEIMFARILHGRSSAIDIAIRLCLSAARAGR